MPGAERERLLAGQRRLLEVKILQAEIGSLVRDLRAEVLSQYPSSFTSRAVQGLVQQMRKEIDALSDRLRKEDPTTLQKTEDTVKGWGAKVKKWFDHPAPEPGHIPEPQSR